MLPPCKPFIFRTLTLAGFTLALGFGQTVTAPAANETIRAADDFATLTFQDPWDMSQQTDLGWYTFGVDSPPANLTNIAFSNGLFTATTNGSQPNFWLLDPFPNGLASPLGKNGFVSPIDSTKYRRFLIRMNLSGGAMANPPVNVNQSLQFIWNLYGNQSTSNAQFTYPGWQIYSIDMPTLGSAAGPAWASSNPVQSLRLQPVNFTGVSVQVDWARLTVEDVTLHRNITWSGGGAVDIYLVSTKTFPAGVVGQIARSVSGGTFDFFVGGLPAGTYYVAITPAGSTSTVSYSAGAWTVNDIPTFTFTSPNPEGSTDDFATVQLNNPWDMDALTDIDVSNNISGLAINNIAAQDEAGNSLGNVRVLSGLSCCTVDDPQLYPLHTTKRGATHRIDTSRYRILSIKWGLREPRDIVNGSVGRVIYKNVGESVENVSNDIILNTLGTANVIQNVIADMKTLDLEPGAGSPSHTGWTGLVDSFRVDPDEFSKPINLFVQSIKLSALEKANASYTINWNFTNAGTVAPTVQLFYDTTGTGFAGTQIVAGLNPTPGSYNWNTSGIANGTYYVYSRIMNGSTVMNQTYARWPVVIDHTASQGTLTLDRSNLNFGATNNGATATSPQVVNVITSSGVAWTASSNNPAVVVSPTSGTGPGSFTVSIQSNSLQSPSTFTATISVAASGVTNSPQTLTASVIVFNPASVGAPIGSFDTPGDGTTGVAGAFPVTGWALDNIEVTSVEISRDPVNGETPGANGLVFIGNATFVEGARPDVANTYPAKPLNTRAGWGLMVLSNFLPAGNGTFRIHAIIHTKTGQAVDLGTKTITVDNAHATKPFGTIDTPSQGGTVSGASYINFGWALTPQPQCIPADGHTITVMVDGVSLGSPVYNQQRSDIQSAFPNYCNTTNGKGAVGLIGIDTTKLTNGVHTISWVVFDDIGRGDGIGSRYFTVLNNSGGSASPEDIPIENTSSVRLKRGFNLNREPEELARERGGEYSVSMEQLGQIELHLGATAGYLIVESQRQPLPIGSTLKGGVFYWHAAPGFLGDYQLEFVRADGTVETVLVNVHPKTF